MKKKIIILLIIISVFFVGKSFFEEKEKVKPPTFNHKNSKLEEEVEIKLNTETEGAKIYYTTDPDEELNVLSSQFKEGDSIPIEYNQNINIRAFAIKKGMEDSKVIEKDYAAKKKTKKPEIRVARINNEYTISFGRDYSSDVYYTLNGEEPTRESNKYESRIRLDGSSVIKAFAIKDNYWDSEIAVQDISMKLDNPQIQIRNIDETEKQIEITTNSEKNKIYYTLDGEEPTRESKEYKKPFTVKKPVKVQAITVKQGYVNSEIEKKEVEIKLKRPKIEIKPFANNKKVILTSENEDDKIYYTLNNTAPTTNSNVYEGDLIIRNTATIQAQSMKEGYNDSDISATNIRVKQVYNQPENNKPEIEKINININNNNNMKGEKIIKVENDNNLILSKSQNNTKNYLKITKVNKKGQKIFDKNIKFVNKIEPYSIILNQQNQYTLLASNNEKLYIYVLDQKGNIIMENQIFKNHLGIKIIPYKNNYIVGSISKPDSNNPHISIAKVSSNLKSIIWQKRLDYNNKKSIENLYDISVDQDNNIIVIGDTNQKDSIDIYLSKLNQKGEVLLKKIIEGNKIDSGYFVKSTINNNYLIAAESNSKYNENKTNQKKNNVLLLLVSTEGNIIQKKIIGNVYNNYPVGLSKQNNTINLIINTNEKEKISSKLYFLNINNEIKIRKTKEIDFEDYNIQDVSYSDNIINALIISSNQKITRIINIIDKGDS